MFKKILLINFFLIGCIMCISCGKGVSTDNTSAQNSSDDTSSESNFKVIYQGFIMVDINKIDDYAMPNDYIILNEVDWETWNLKYTSEYPYYLNDLGMNWDEKCLVVRAYYGAKDFYNTISIIEDVSFDNNIVNVTYDEKENQIYAFNDSGDINDYTKRNIAFYVIMVNKPSNLNSIDSSFLKYETYAQTNNK